jgi:hypothetical protein
VQYSSCNCTDIFYPIKSSCSFLYLVCSCTCFIEDVWLLNKVERRPMWPCLDYGLILFVIFKHVNDFVVVVMFYSSQNRPSLDGFVCFVKRWTYTTNNSSFIRTRLNNYTLRLQVLPPPPTESSFYS